MKKGKGLVLLVGLMLLTVVAVGCGRQVTISQVVEPEPVSATVWGELPKLPATVEVVYSDGKRRDVTVEWETSQLNSRILLNDFTVQGKLAGTDHLVSVVVEVQDEQRLQLTTEEFQGSDVKAVISSKLASQNIIGSWSPDGTAVTYFRSVGEQERLYLWRVAEKQSRLIHVDDGGSMYDCKWSYDGKYFSFTQSTDVMVNITVVATTAANIVGDTVSLMGAAWSPDTQELLLTIGNNIEADTHTGSTFDIAIYNADTRQTTVLVEGDAESLLIAGGWEAPNVVRYSREYFDGRPSETHTHTITR